MRISRTIANAIATIATSLARDGERVSAFAAGDVEGGAEGPSICIDEAYPQRIAADLQNREAGRLPIASGQKAASRIDALQDLGTFRISRRAADQEHRTAGP